MKKTLFIFLAIIFTFSFSCFKEKANKELKDQQILSYINELQLEFDTLNSGILLHKTFEGLGKKYTPGDLIKICFTGLYLDPNNGVNNGYFAQNDTFAFRIGNREILSGWNDLIVNFKSGGVGIAIFPYDKAYGYDHTPNIPANCTLVYFFRILSDIYRIDQNSVFWEYAGQFDSIMQIFDDSLIYVKYFDGLGPKVNSSGTSIEYQFFTINDSLIAEADSIFIDFNDINLPVGLIEGISNMNEGEMGKIIVPPSLAYTTSNIFNLKPFSAIYYETRAISSDHEIEQKSKINKYIYVNDVKQDSVFPSGIYYFKNVEGTGISPILNKQITLSDSLYIINHDFPVKSCQNCTKTLNSSNFTSGQIEILKMLKEGGSGTFILPYSEAYGSIGEGIIGPYETLIYKVKLISVN